MRYAKKQRRRLAVRRKDYDEMLDRLSKGTTDYTKAYHRPGSLKK